MSLFHMNAEQAEKIRSSFDKFRILIIGRANAGKTTILQRICNTTEDPVVYVKGKKVIVASSSDRGLHDIEDELVFQNSPGFRFHDSRGFEAGGIDEFMKVKAFIEGRSMKRELSDRLHTIWYCIPVSDSRPFTTAENQFFSECGTGNVPVIVIFTKFDALDNKAFEELRKEGMLKKEARERAPQRAVVDFEARHLERLYKLSHPPKAHIYLRDMNEEGSKCGELVERTTNCLDNEALQELFVSMQRDNMNVCIKYAVERAALPIIILNANTKSRVSEYPKLGSLEEVKVMILKILDWFPQYPRDWLRSWDASWLRDWDRDWDRSWLADWSRVWRSRSARWVRSWDSDSPDKTVDKLCSSLFSEQQLFALNHGLVQCAIITAIVADFGYYLWDNCDVDPSKAVKVYQERMSTEPVARAAERAFEDFVRSQSEDQLARDMIQIVLDNRMPTELMKDPIVTGEKKKFAFF